MNPPQDSNNRPVSFEATRFIDIRQTKCPLNFVKVKLALEKLSHGQILEVLLVADSESGINVPKSLQQEGYQILDSVLNTENQQTLWVLQNRC